MKIQSTIYDYAMYVYADMRNENVPLTVEKNIYYEKINTNKS